MLTAISKAHICVWDPAQVALSAPIGPVSSEISVDVQRVTLRARGVSARVAVQQEVPDPG
jgi:hypothetical protein